MKGRNPLIIFLVIGFVLIGVFVVFSSSDEQQVETVGKGKIKVQNPVTSKVEPVDNDKLPQEFKKIVIDMQDLQSTITTLNEQVAKLKNPTQPLQNQVVIEGTEEIEALEKPDEDLFPLPNLQPSQSSVTATPSPLGAEVDQLMTPAAELSKLSKQWDKQPPVSPLGTSLQGSAQSVQGEISGDEIVWIEPIDSTFPVAKRQAETSKKASSFLSEVASPEVPGFLDEVTSKAMGEAGLEAAKEPRFTIPDGSIITNALSVTALVGRIPIGGKVTDPWRFKISTGRSILMPNDHELEGLEKTILQGDAIGDLNLRCVSGNIDTITFIFNDGRIVTHKSKGNKNNYLGYISDRYANPCLSGDLITNAPQAMTQMGLLGIGSGMASAISEAETQTNTMSDGTVVKSVVGDEMKYATYRGVAQGVEDVRSWFSQRMGQFFDVIYVKGGQVVDVHITDEIKLDYDPVGRKVVYETVDNHNSGYMD
ncbi:TIGR03752 family integrating conjugative element protein [Thiomicrorhabdus indica]|uniref:TIGR03752 family integrating conjugative element protein n=1 Tax=Thiomicrorhabdus indica TaxID=2267253 RepID=UPI00102DF647|nr:TIGR03752 family integrating conjugative element protein [Thiomicrorhabdus indica]